MSLSRPWPRFASQCGATAIVAATLLAACGEQRTTAPLRAAASGALADKGGNKDDNDAPRVVDVSVAQMQPNNVIATIDGVNVFGGGFGSALAADPNGNDNDVYSLTDRGPNIAGSGNNKVFLLPDFHPQVGHFKREGHKLVRLGTIVLKDAAGNPLTGRPPGGTGNTGEIPRALDGTLLPNDPNGIDSEGLRFLSDGSFWVSDEYGPFLVHFDPTGRTIERDSPTSGPHPIPQVLLRRQPNKGMEGLASLDNGRVLVGIIQNPLTNPDAAAAKQSSLLRILVLDVVTGKTKQYAYLLDNAKYGASEIEAVSPTQFIVDERDGNFFGDAKSPSVQKKLYLIDVSNATDISDPTNGASGLLVGGKTLEQLTVADFATNHIVPVQKTLLVDLLAFGYTHDKAEGVALLDGGRLIAVSNDDDFGVSDNGNGGLIQKVLPSGAVDHNEVWYFRLNKSLYDK